MPLYLRSTTLVGLCVLVGCAQPSPSRARADDRETVQKELSGEMSLKADRDELKELRKDVPAEKQKSNDELALYLQLIKQGSEQPQMVRDKFTVLVERRRTSFRERVAKLRENYRRDEAKRRDEYLDGQKTKRTDYLAKKRTPEQMRDFFAKQDKERQSFFADERDRRTSFESDVSAQSKDFDSYMREKTNEFNEKYRLYSKKFSERPKAKKAVTGESDDFKRMDELPAKPLGTED